LAIRQFDLAIRFGKSICRIHLPVDTETRTQHHNKQEHNTTRPNTERDQS
jgi:hypothetical protein